MAKKEAPIMTDLTKQYIINLYVKGERDVFLPVVCNVTASRGLISATAAENPELFEVHRFYDEYFQWLLRRGKIKLYNKDSENNNEP